MGNSFDTEKITKFKSWPGQQTQKEQGNEEQQEIKEERKELNEEKCMYRTTKSYTNR